MIKYFVRTTGERTLDESFQQIDYELLVDTEHKPVKSFIDQVMYLTSLNCEVVILEDDVVLCRDFKARIEKIIEDNPIDTINFFYEPNWYFESTIEKPSVWHQCVYYSINALNILNTNLKHFNKDMKFKHYDVVARFALLNKCMCYYPRPCLVQHLDFDSIIGNIPGNRTTPYFIDYLEDLGIDYKDAKEHKEKLVEYKNKWFEKYAKNRLHSS